MQLLPERGRTTFYDFENPMRIIKYILLFEPLFLGLSIFSQTDVLIKESGFYRTNGKLEMKGKLFSFENYGDLYESRFQLSEIGLNGESNQVYLSPKNRRFYKSSNASDEGVVFVSFAVCEKGGSKAFITFLDTKLKVKWEHEINSERHLHPTSIVNDGKNGCYLAIVIDDEMKLIHFTQNGNIDRKHNFGYRPVHNFYGFQVAMTSDGLLGVLTTRSDLSRIVSPCTPDFDFIGFKWKEDGSVDTLFFEDLDPYSSYTRYQILPAKHGKKNLMWRVEFLFDPVNSSYGSSCSHDKGGLVNFIKMAPSEYPLQCSNYLVYIPKSYTLLYGTTSDYRQVEMKIDSFGLPQRLIASSDEDGIIWNTYQTENISKIDFQGKTIWTSKIPSPKSTVVVVTKIGYLSSGGYYVVGQERESGQEHIYMFDENGNWL